jgi:hypothetical protein
VLGETVEGFERGMWSRAEREVEITKMRMEG